jgi:TRAP-type C4-dicarboxylate transport system substrate-binding protein
VSASSLGLGLTLTSYSTFAQTTQTPIIWKVSSAFSPGSILYKDFLPRLSEEMTKRSNRRFQIKAYPPGALLGTMEIYTAVQKGVVEGGMSAGLYHGRIIPESVIETGLPQSFANYSDASDYYYKYRNGRALNLIREAYRENGTYYLGVYPLASYVLMTKFPVNKLEDLKGKKMRTFGPYSLIFEALHAAPVSISGDEQYTALQRRTVDGTIYPFYALEMYKLKEVIDYVILPPIAGSIMINLFFNIDAYEKLPADIKDMLNQVSRELVPWLCTETQKQDEIYIAEAKAKGIRFITLPAEEVHKLREISVKTWDVYAKKSPRCEELVSILKDYLKEKKQ